MTAVESPSRYGPVGHEGARVDITQRPAFAVNGWLGVLVLAGCAWASVIAAQHNSGWLWLPLLVSVLVIAALVIVPPGQTSVIQFFGRYVGTVSRPGFWWVLPLTIRRTVSIRVRNFETNHLKVNDADGNPVEIAAIVVWQVADTARSGMPRILRDSLRSFCSSSVSSVPSSTIEPAIGSTLNAIGRTYFSGRGNSTAEPSWTSSVARPATSRICLSSSSTPASPLPDTAW